MKNYLLIVLAMTTVSLQAAVADTASLNGQLWQELNKSYTSYYAKEKLPDNTDKIKDLVERGADVNFRNPFVVTSGWQGVYTPEKGETPLSIAVTIENVPLVEFLLNKKANPNLTDLVFETPPLFNTIIGDKPDQPKMVELLLRHGARVNMKDRYGTTPLDVLKMYLFADRPISQGQQRIIDMLQAHGAR